MAVTTYYVDTDVVGGDGSGIDWANACHDLYAAEDVLEKDLDTANEQMTIVCSGATIDNTNVMVVGWTTSITDYLAIVAANEAGHYDRAIKTSYDITRYHLEVTDDCGIEINEEYVRIIGLQVRAIYASVVSDHAILLGVIGAAGISHIDSCRCQVISESGTPSCRGILINDTDWTAYIYNCIVEGITYDGDMGIYARYAANVYIYNCIVRNFVDGIAEANAAPCTVTNSISFNNTDDFDGTFTLLTCASDDNDVGAQEAHDADWSDDFIDAANGDFTLKLGSLLIDAGTDLSGGAIITKDIDWVVRTGTWDIGADEYVAAGGSIVPVAMHHYKMQRRGF